MCVGTFKACNKSKADMTYGDIKAANGFVFVDDILMTLTSVGRTGDVVTYLSEEESSAYGIKAGWYDKNYLNEVWDWESPIPDEFCFTNKKLPFGTMFIVQGTEGATVNFAGEVIGENHQYEILGGQYNMIGNATPADLVLGDISASNGFVFVDDIIMTLTNVGRTGDVLTFLSADESSSYGIAPGWYDKNYLNEVWDWESPIPEEYIFNKLPIPAGYGFIAQGTEGAIVEIPSPLAD